MKKILFLFLGSFTFTGFSDTVQLTLENNLDTEVVVMVYHDHPYAGAWDRYVIPPGGRESVVTVWSSGFTAGVIVDGHTMGWLPAWSGTAQAPPPTIHITQTTDGTVSVTAVAPEVPLPDIFVPGLSGALPDSVGFVGKLQAYADRYYKFAVGLGFAVLAFGLLVAWVMNDGGEDEEEGESI